MDGDKFKRPTNIKGSNSEWSEKFSALRCCLSIMNKSIEHLHVLIEAQFMCYRKTEYLFRAMSYFSKAWPVRKEEKDHDMCNCAWPHRAKSTMDT